jgi:riboflavin biosynthesis pyrimidine reductase
LVEGGSQTLTRIISAGYGDIFHVFVAPTLTGAEKNIIAIQKLLHQATRLKTISTAQLESDILIEMISEEIENRIF